MRKGRRTGAFLTALVMLGSLMSGCAGETHRQHAGKQRGGKQRAGQQHTGGMAAGRFV